jgi:hypothetical protein
METCPVCEREFKDKRGLSGHMQFGHASNEPVASGSYAALAKEVAELKRTVSGLGVKVSDAVVTEKDMRIRDLLAQCESTKAAYQSELDAAVAENGKLTRQLASMEAELAERNTGHDVLTKEHLRYQYEHCTNCRAGLDAWLAEMNALQASVSLSDLGRKEATLLADAIKEAEANHDWPWEQKECPVCHWVKKSFSDDDYLKHLQGHKQ